MLNSKYITILLIFLGSISLILTLVQKPENYEKSRLKIFFEIATVIGAILVALGLIYSTQVVEDNKKLTKAQQTLSLIERCELNIIRKTREFYKNCPNFVQSLFPQKGIFIQDHKDVIDDESCVLQLSFEMLQAFEDHFTGSIYDLTEETAWAGTFLQWTSSKKFYEIFLLIYPNFVNRTYEYANLLFEYSRKYNLDTAKNLQKVAKEFSIDPRLKNICKIKVSKNKF